MKINDIKDLGIQKGILSSSKNGSDILLPLIKRFLNYLAVPWADACCGDSGTATPSGGGSTIGATSYDTNADAVAALGVGIMYKSTTLINGSPIILITV